MELLVSNEVLIVIVLGMRMKKRSAIQLDSGGGRSKSGRSGDGHHG